MLDKMTGHKMVCPWWLCFTFDNPLRKLLHNPEAILTRYVRPGSTVIDIGPGMGYFTIPLARLAGPTGRVIAIDVQGKMLEALTRRARRSGVAERIQPHLASPDSLGNQPKADFVMAFWMVHEVPDQRKFLAEIFGFVKPGGLFLLVEPILHVRKQTFLRTVQTANEIGFIEKDRPRIHLSHSVLLTCNKTSL